MNAALKYGVSAAGLASATMVAGLLVNGDIGNYEWWYVPAAFALGTAAGWVKSIFYDKKIEQRDGTE